MAEPQPFKEFYGVNLAHDLADRIGVVHTAFPKAEFVRRVSEKIAPLELKARVDLMAANLRDLLPSDYPAALKILLGILGPPLATEEGMFNEGFWVMPIAVFVERFGLDHFEESMAAIHAITQRFTSEFAIRPYLVRYPEKSLVILGQWAKDPSVHVRRLVSEGTRTRLPWAGHLQMFIKEPGPVLALLEQLKDDPSPYVRKSVANNLNSIIKDHPDRVFAILTRWYEGGDENRRWTVRHALRNLIKEGHPGALALLGYGDAKDIAVGSFTVSPAAIHIGQSVTLRLEVVNKGSQAHEVVIDFLVHYVKANGKSSPKVFKWASQQIAAGQTLRMEKKLAMREVTIRKLYAGMHHVEVQINGAKMASVTFELNQ
jgi:3-methyladenine DNA glycosylase AlkC